MDCQCNAEGHFTFNVRTSTQKKDGLLKKPFSRSIEEPVMWERQKPKLNHQILELTAIFCEIQPHLHMCLPFSLKTDYAFSQVWGPLLTGWLSTWYRESDIHTDIL